MLFNSEKMSKIKSNFINKILYIAYFFKISMFLLLIWIFAFFNNICYTIENVKSIHKLNGTYGIGVHRLLSITELEIGFEQNNIKEGISQNYESNELKNESEDTSIYRRLKKNSSNHMYSYRKNLKNTYAKKKGLEKLDCYFEKKIFNNIDKIHKLAENGNYDKKSFKNIILKKYGYKIIFSSLFSLLGLIIPILAWAKVKVFSSSEQEKSLGKLIPYLNESFFSIYCTIFILTIIYIFIKAVKYEKLKTGKGKMNRKEYICFCKEIFKIN